MAKTSKSRTTTSEKLSKHSKLQYKFSTSLIENHDQPIFGVKFNPHLEESGHYVFSTVGSNRISLYECLENGSIKLIQAYVDPDPEEIYYCCAWSYDEATMLPLLVAAGARGILRLMTPSTMECLKHYKGHGHSVNDLKFHPKDCNLLLSVSKDHSLRLWNIKTDVCVAIFGGIEGHRDEVLSADFHLQGHKVISCGMDHSLKIWSLDNEKVETAIRDSYEYNPLKSSGPFDTAKCQFPTFTTRDIHRNYVDCVRWFGNFVLSKSCENCIVCWKPGKLENETDIFLSKAQYTTDSTTTLIYKFELKESEIWFMRFSMDKEQKTMALGNMIGKTYVWDIDVDDPSLHKVTTLSHPKCNAALRQTCFSQDGSILLCVSDDSSLWRWDRVESSLSDKNSNVADVDHNKE